MLPGSSRTPDPLFSRQRLSRVCVNSGRQGTHGAQACHSPQRTLIGGGGGDVTGGGGMAERDTAGERGQRGGQWEVKWRS